MLRSDWFFCSCFPIVWGVYNSIYHHFTNMIPPSVHTNTVPSNFHDENAHQKYSVISTQHLPSPQSGCPLLPGCVAIIHSSTQKGSRHWAFPYLATCTKIKSCKAPSKIPGWSNCNECSHASASAKPSWAIACSPLGEQVPSTPGFFSEELGFSWTGCVEGGNFYLFPNPCMCG